ncbi:unnamed protein product [Prorocentrum cordatum]|uniref:Uncharacterized protein n=1 Tax=Prorocentrum cordatum TaxID=2364126 RepID=A0ABN9VWH2_9DINO|nr:unnamed protein product [Polarella glacialis]
MPPPSLLPPPCLAALLAVTGPSQACCQGPRPSKKFPAWAPPPCAVGRPAGPRTMAARTLALVAAAVAALPTAAGDGRLGLVRAQATPRSCRGGRLGGRRAGVGRRRRQETRGGQRDAEGDSDAPDEGGGAPSRGPHGSRELVVAEGKGGRNQGIWQLEDFAPRFFQNQEKCAQPPDCDEYVRPGHRAETSACTAHRGNTSHG